MKAFSRFSLILILVLITSQVKAQNHYNRFESIDVQHYRFELNLNDRSNQISGIANIKITFLKPSYTCRLDLVECNNDGIGMQVENVVFEDNFISFKHKDSVLELEFPRQIQTSETIEIKIDYIGNPADGLIISENKYGDRTFFGDNWPDRARNWLPCVDHPSDKATVEFLVYAPAHYKVVANGRLLERKVLAENNVSHWKEDVPISTKLMVIGAADFVVGNDTVWNGIPVNAWVFKENADHGLYNYRFGTKALQYYSELIGPYSYEKLAHVQSKTHYGGMENASCIFYSENSAVSDQSQERLFAHEVAHQWFGNSATEQNWHHVWLSEGFATYLTHIYNQHFYGEQVFR
nr:M1 family metallopeptidase [Bacteroidales bacterium]